MPVISNPPDDGPSSDSDNSDSASDHSSSSFVDETSNTMDRLLVSTVLGEPSSHVSDDISIQMRQYVADQASRGDREEFIRKENAAIARLGRDFIKSARRHAAKGRNRATDITAYDPMLLARLARRYFTWMNSTYSVLHECVFQLQLEKCRTIPEGASPLDMFQVSMVMALALASISRPHLPVSEIGRAAHDFWKLANKSLSNVLRVRGIQRLQNILLLLQYTLLVPRAGNLWQLCGSAMRLATEMGLYAEPNPRKSFDALTLDTRRRLFWTCYCIDRILAPVAGRPPSLADDWVTAQMPALVEDRLITVNGILTGPTCQLKVAQIQQIRICQLQSEIHSRLYTPGETADTSCQSVWTWHMYDQLRLWRDSFTYATPLVTKEWMELQFHVTIVLLFRPSPKRQNPSSEEGLHVALHSAGEAMKLVKTMHRDLSAVFSWLTVHNLFMCGLTFCNSLNELTERNSSHKLCISIVEIFLQIQACSAMLETLSALEAGANERIRNVFEMASSKVLKNIASMAGSFPHRHEGCIWAQIARSDSLGIQRPTMIEGITIGIQKYSTILQNLPIGVRINGNGADRISCEEHFYKHDIDAASTAGIFGIQINAPALYEVISVPPLGTTTAANPSRQLNATLHERQQSELGIPGPNSSTDPIHSLLVGSEDPGMNRMAALFSAAAEAEPIRSCRDMPENWSDSNLGAELEQWFLYPFLDFPAFSASESDQLFDP